MLGPILKPLLTLGAIATLWCCDASPRTSADGDVKPPAPIVAPPLETPTAKAEGLVEPPAPGPDLPAPPVRRDGTILGGAELMGTTVSINVFLHEGASAAVAGVAMQEALDEMARLEDIMSEWRSESEVSALNRAAGQPARKVTPELFEVLQRSREISEATGGAFDVTFHGVGQLWSFRPGSIPPTPELVREHLALIDWRKLELNAADKTARLAASGMKIGLGAIAKGYAVDRASAVLRSRGFPNHVVEAGGDTYVSGTKDGTLWQVGVQDPSGRGAIGVLPASDISIVTSGDYERYFDYEGKRYSHIIDPKTGWPIEAERSPTSVTAVAKNATDADAYCTALAVMGIRDGLRFVDDHEGLDAVFVDHEGKVFVSDGLRETFRRIQPGSGPSEDVVTP